MPDIIKTWYTIANDTVGGGSNMVYKQRMLFSLKKALTGATSARSPTDVLVALGSLAGTIVLSSDSTAVDTSDLLVASTNFIHDIPGNNHSWYVVEFEDFYGAGLSQFMLFDCRSTNEGLAYISFSRNAYTGGTITDAPTAVDEIVVKDGATSVGDLVVSDCWDGEATVSTSGVLHLQVSADGECYRWFMCRGGTLHTFAGFQRSQVSPASGMTNDAVFWWMSQDSDANAITWAAVQPLQPFYLLDNAQVVRTAYATCPVHGAGNTSIVSQTANAHDSTRFLPRIFLYANTPRGVPSVLIDMWWASSSDAVGTKAPSVSETLAQVGDSMIPWPLDRIFTAS